MNLELITSVTGAVHYREIGKPNPMCNIVKNSTKWKVGGAVVTCSRCVKNYGREDLERTRIDAGLRSCLVCKYRFVEGDLRYLTQRVEPKVGSYGEDNCNVIEWIEIPYYLCVDCNATYKESV